MITSLGFCRRVHPFSESRPAVGKPPTDHLVIVILLECDRTCKGGSPVMISRNNVQESPMAHNICCHCLSLWSCYSSYVYPPRVSRRVGRCRWSAEGPRPKRGSVRFAKTDSIKVMIGRQSPRRPSPYKHRGGEERKERRQPPRDHRRTRPHELCAAPRGETGGATRRACRAERGED